MPTIYCCPYQVLKATGAPERPKVTVHKCAGIIRMLESFNRGPYVRKYGLTRLKSAALTFSKNWVCGENLFVLLEKV